jgi:hypothetical protein
MFWTVTAGFPGMKRPRWRVTARAVVSHAAARRVADDHRESLALVEIGGGGRSGRQDADAGHQETEELHRKGPFGGRAAGMRASQLEWI